MAQGILLDKTSLLEVIFDGNNYQINYGFHTFQKFSKDDLAALRQTVIQLVIMGVKKTKLSKLFNINRKTIEKWEKKYIKSGMLSLINMQDGRPAKCDEIVEKYIIDLYAKLENRRDHKKIIIDEVKKLFGISISRELIRRVVNKHKSSDKEKNVEGEDSNDIETIEDVEKKEIKNGGILLSLPFLAKHRIGDLIPKEKDKIRGYNFKEIVMSIAMLLTGGLLKNEEQIKINDSPCMGEIIRKKILPSLRTIRRIVPALIEKIDVKKLKKDCAQHFLKLYAASKIFYIDGHFMPYHGKEKILYGYNPLRRIAMRGRTSYVVNSDTGRPIYQILSENFDNFNDNIIKLVRFLKEMGYKNDILLVFDRGGFGEEFFNSIYQKTLFICWYKGKVFLMLKKIM